MKINGNPDGGGGGSAVINSLNVTSNGTYTAGGGVDGYSPVEVSVPIPEFVTGTLNVSVNNTYTVEPPVDGWTQVVVNVPQSVTGFTEKEYTEGNVLLEHISNSASYVASNVFINNLQIKTVNLPLCSFIGDSAFKSCYSMTQVNVPECTKIGSYAFYECINLNSIYMENIESVGQNAFYGCRSLSDIGVFSNLTTITESCFRNCYEISSVNFPKCSKVLYGAFGYCSTLSYISFPMCFDLVTTAFEHTDLRSVYLPNCVNIANWVFNDCNRLSEVNLPVAGLFGTACFERCSLLKTLYIASETYEVPNYMLSTTNSLNSIYVYAGNLSRFEVALGWSSLSSLFIGVGDANIPMLSYDGGNITGQTRAITSRFLDYLSINKNDVLSVDLPNCNVVYSYTFSGCVSLAQVSLPNCIGVLEGAFSGCRSLSQLVLPVCSYIGVSAFAGIAQSSSFYLTLGYENVVLGSNSMFTYNNIGNVNIYVPSSLVDAYKSAQYWSNYSSRIFPISSPEPPVIEGYYFSYTPTNLTGLMRVNGGAYEYIDSYNGLYNDQTWDGNVIGEAFYIEGTTISFVTFETNANGVEGYAFSGCTTLTSVRFTDTSNGVYVQDSAFDGCTSLSTVYVDLSDFTCTFDLDAFTGTPLAEGVGSIYVPAAVYNDYLTECEGSPFVTQFVSY